MPKSNNKAPQKPRQQANSQAHATVDSRHGIDVRYEDKCIHTSKAKKQLSPPKYPPPTPSPPQGPSLDYHPFADAGRSRHWRSLGSAFS